MAVPHYIKPTQTEGRNVCTLYYTLCASVLQAMRQNIADVQGTLYEFDRNVHVGMDLAWWLCSDRV